VKPLKLSTPLLTLRAKEIIPRPIAPITMRVPMSRIYCLLPWLQDRQEKARLKKCLTARPIDLNNQEDRRCFFASVSESGQMQRRLEQ
jgi:hypothetical protein